MSPSEQDQKFHPISDPVVAFGAASTPFLDLYFNELSQAGGSSFTFATASTSALVIGLSLLVRRRYPFVVLGVLLVSAILAAIAGGEELPIPFLIGSGIALYTIASLYPRRTAVITGLVTLVIVLPVEAKSAGGTLISLDPVFWVSLAVAAGDAVRSRRINMRVLEDRARRAEETREQEARARVAEERLHIARELHDIVAHHIAVVNIQAGLAERAMSRNAPETAATAIAHVNEAARLALDDLSAVLHLLRGSRDIDHREPAPGLA